MFACMHIHMHIVHAKINSIVTEQSDIDHQSSCGHLMTTSMAAMYINN